MGHAWQGHGSDPVFKANFTARYVAFLKQINGLYAGRGKPMANITFYLAAGPMGMQTNAALGSFTL